MWFSVVLAVGIHLVAAEVCPGGRKTCNLRMTCCELPSGEQGCCPYENATCCPDKVHCCPYGSECLTDHCLHEYEATKIMVNYQEPPKKLNSESHPASNNSLMVRCPDGNECSEFGTCCEISPNSYGCCPFSDGVCCKDHGTCCPQTHMCLAEGWCQPKAAENSLEPVKQIPVNTICPGGHQSCPAGDTCCPQGYGRWGCCPLLAATCCADQTHCCPHGYHCTNTGYCVRGTS